MGTVGTLEYHNFARTENRKNLSRTTEDNGMNELNL